MNEIISLKQKRHQKQLKYERKMLKELSLVEIKKKIDETPIVSFYRYFGVANGKGRDFYNYTPKKNESLSID